MADRHTWGMFTDSIFADLHGYSRAAGRVRRLHLGVGGVERSLVHELVVELQGLQNFDI